MLEVYHRTQTARIARIAVALLVASPLGGCATLMQAFSTVQPSGPLMETESNAGSGTFGDASADAAATADDGGWTTRVYHGWAGPSSQM
jgi:hypothetical protein